MKSLNIKNFLRFSLAIYPLTICILANKELLDSYTGNGIITNMAIFLLFVGINWLWGQKLLQNYLLLISLALGLYTTWVWLLPGSGNILLSILGTVIIYFLTFLVVQFFQFATWIPFLLHYLYLNRKNLDRLNIDSA